LKDEATEKLNEAGEKLGELGDKAKEAWNKMTGHHDDPAKP
jgi:ArsR family metal-binding transcriptional regulator